MGRLQFVDANDAIWREIMLKFGGATAPLLQAASSVSYGKLCPLRTVERLIPPLSFAG